MTTKDIIASIFKDPNTKYELTESPSPTSPC